MLSPEEIHAFGDLAAPSEVPDLRTVANLADLFDPARPGSLPPARSWARIDPAELYALVARETSKAERETAERALRREVAAEGLYSPTLFGAAQIIERYTAPWRTASEAANVSRVQLLKAVDRSPELEPVLDRILQRIRETRESRAADFESKRPTVRDALQPKLFRDALALGVVEAAAWAQWAEKSSGRIVWTAAVAEAAQVGVPSTLPTPEIPSKPLLPLRPREAYSRAPQFPVAPEERRALSTSTAARHTAATVAVRCLLAIIAGAALMAGAAFTGSEALQAVAAIAVLIGGGIGLLPGVIFPLIRLSANPGRVPPLAYGDPSKLEDQRTPKQFRSSGRARAVAEAVSVYVNAAPTKPSTTERYDRGIFTAAAVPQATEPAVDSEQPQLQVRLDRVGVAHAALDRAWLDYTLDADAMFLRKPQLRNDDFPATRTYREAMLALAEAQEEMPAALTGEFVHDAELALAAAEEAWSAANLAAAETGTAELPRREQAALRRSHAHLTALANPSLTRELRDERLTQLRRELSILETVPVQWAAVEKMPALETVLRRAITACDE